MTVSHAQFRRDNRAGIDKLLDWLRMHLVILLCGGFILGIALEETCFAVKTIASAKHQKQNKHTPPNGFAEALSSRPQLPSVAEPQNIQTVLADTPNATAPVPQDSTFSPVIYPAAKDHYQMAVYYPSGIRLKTFVNR